MDYNYGARGYLLPKGCKDLIDVVNVVADPRIEVANQEDGLIITLKMAHLQRKEVDITIDGGRLLFVCNPSGQGLRTKVLTVPPNYDLARALTTYTGDALRVFVPKR